MSVIFFIAAGGAIGAVGRHMAIIGVNYWLGQGFPYGTLLVNVAGSFLLGVLIESLAITWSYSLELRNFFVIGLLGAFTTFSAFSFDIFSLIERGELFIATLYAAASVILSVVALFVGILVFRYFIT
jgi:CrcB protein